MRIAVPYEAGRVSDHFGRTARFKIYEIEDGKVKTERIEQTDGRGHFYMTQFLVNQGVDTVLLESCGSPSQAALEIAGIELVMGVEGDADAAVEAYLARLERGNP